ncbi:hypothetical protein Golomagni_00908 [Golovinomyces magnicellulatus]|nr:hypothetical protein Golomagni_00908 [Golovinomyces magnicellulatus]
MKGNRVEQQLHKGGWRKRIKRRAGNWIARDSPHQKKALRTNISIPPLGPISLFWGGRVRLNPNSVCSSSTRIFSPSTSSSFFNCSSRTRTRPRSLSLSVEIRTNSVRTTKRQALTQLPVVECRAKSWTESKDTESNFY